MERNGLMCENNKSLWDTFRDQALELRRVETELSDALKVNAVMGTKYRKLHELLERISADVQIQIQYAAPGRIEVMTLGVDGEDALKEFGEIV